MPQPLSFVKYLIPLIALGIACVACNSSSDKEAEGDREQIESPDDMPNPITFSDDITNMESIRAETEKTMEAVNSGAVDSTSFSYDCNGEKKGTVTFYRTGGTLRMVERNYSEYSHTHGTERFFVSGGESYFVYRKNTDWGFKSSNETVDNVKEQRFYVLGDTLAQCLTKEYEIHSDGTDSFDPEKIENESGPCPPMGELMGQYELLLSHRDTTSAIGCLQKE